jgi:RNA-dependent RNA polymerase
LQILYEAKDLNNSTRPRNEIYEEARAIYKIAYTRAVEKVKVSYCSFAWRVAGEALCELYLREMGNANHRLVDWDFVIEMRR